MVRVSKELPSVQAVAEQYAVDPSWSGAVSRIAGPAGFLGHRQRHDFSFSEGRRLSPQETGFAIVWELESAYDPENETTLQKTATLIARHKGFLRKQGINTSLVRAGMLHTAAEIVVGHAREYRDGHEGAQYYEDQLLKHLAAVQQTEDLMQRLSLIPERSLSNAFKGLRTFLGK